MTLMPKNKPQGGEFEIRPYGYSYGVTNSGRSSLRWIILSMRLEGKRVLVPDFVCQVVVDVFREYNVDLVFYRIRKDFEFSLPCGVENVDALYLVRYFGHDSKSFVSEVNYSKLPLIIDDVFGVDVPSFGQDVRWWYFNSLRKVTKIADFSQVISNVALCDIDKGRLANFSNLKYKAKEAKFSFLEASIGNEKDYLSDFATAEAFLNSNKGIFSPEDRSVYEACVFFERLIHERSIRQENLACAKQHLSNFRFLDINVRFPTFLPLILKNRDRVQNKIKEYKIFLAVHWPRNDCKSNELSRQILSLPVDVRFTKKIIKETCELIEDLDK